MKIQLIRHATMYLEVNGKKILVDPMLSKAESMEAAQNAGNNRRNPLVELPKEVPDVKQLDGVIVTHSHRDHFDEEAANQLV